MGLILDTTVLIAADRKTLNAAEMLRTLAVPAGETVAISSITLMEFATGIARASSDERRNRRRLFVDDLRSLVPVFSFGADLALRAGLLNGELQQKGVGIASLDLMIGITALEAGFGIATRNVKHFQLIPGLRIVEI